MFDLIFPLFVDVKAIRKDVDAGMNKAATQLASKQSVAELALLWVKEELRKNRSKIEY